MIAYGALLAYLVISTRADKHYTKNDYWYRYKPGPSEDPTAWLTYCQIKLHYFTTYAGIYLDVGGFRAAGVGLLCLLTWPLPFGLLFYHIYLIWAGMTTNESGKWADWRDDMADGAVFLGHRREDTLRQEESPRPQLPDRNENQDSPSSSTSSLPLAEEEEPATIWPIESRHILVRTMNGQPPQNLPSRLRSVADEESFERVYSLSAVENAYDLGFWDNFVEALQ